MDEDGDVHAEAARAKFRTAFAEQTTDWPAWLIGVDHTPTKQADASVTIVKPHGGHLIIPLIVKRNKHEKTRYFQTLSTSARNQYRVVLIAHPKMKLSEVRANLFKKLASMRKQFLYLK